MLPDTMPVLEGHGVRLRPFDVALDADLVREAGLDEFIPQVTTVPYLGTDSEIRDFIERQHARLPSGVGCSFVVVDVASDEPVGQIGYWPKDFGAGRASIGYWIVGSKRQCGFVAAACAVLVEWAWTLPGLNRLEAYVEPWNVGSWKALERTGFQREGLLRSWELVGGEPRDMYVYSQLHSDLR